MASEVKVEVIREETIRPSSPTPHHRKLSSLSLFDQVMPEFYIPLLLFYPSNSDESKTDHRYLVSERSKLLKRSLSETLTHFYPVAGTFQSNDVSICCNDHGVAYFEAQVNCPVSKVLEQPGLGMQTQLLPNEMESGRLGTDYLLLVQANFFECGGMAIGVHFSHKIMDAYTLGKFINSWAAIAHGYASSTTDVVPHGEFGAAASLFPPLDFLNSPQTSIYYVKENVLKRRFVFNASKIAALKSKAATATVPNPTRVEVVSALIWKCAMEASRSNLGIVRPSAWCQFVNMRKILMKPLPKDLLGNFVGCIVAKTEQKKVDRDDLQSLVAILRKCFEEFKEKYANGISGVDVFQQFKELWEFAGKDDIDNYSSTSWCRFPFYEANFGWGKPWISSPSSVEVKNMIKLMDLSDGIGIEVRMTLKEEEMAIFENNQELLAYASLNPNVVV